MDKGFFILRWLLILILWPMLAPMLGPRSWGLTPEAIAQLSDRKIVCTSPREADFITIRSSGVLSLQRQRFLASTRETLNAPWQRAQHGLLAIFQHRGSQYTVQIKNVDHFAEVDDHFTIRSKQGQQITFPLYCINIATD